MRFFVRGIDRLFRLLQGVYEFNTSPTCLLRLRHTQVPHKSLTAWFYLMGKYLRGRW